ncbi:MAG TPA: DUF6263 family protein, partial [Bacteroidales bacterium]|nr:DUF6263 family protein [Bacteroidales bacterium]
LEFKPVMGAEYPVSMEIKQTTTIRVPMMGDVTSESNQILEAVVTLAEKTEKGYMVEARLTRMTVKATGQGQSQVFDSEGEDIMSEAIRTMLNKPFRMIVSPLGEIVEQMTVEDTVFNAADETLATQYARRRRETAMQQIKSIFSENTIKSVVQAGLTKFPDQELKIPAVWTDEENSAELGAIVTVQNRLQEVIGNRATLEARSIIMPDPNAQKSDAAQRMEKISGNGEAKSVIDAGTGWVIESTGSQSLKGDYVVEQGGQIQSMPVTMEVSIKITSVRQ